MIVSFKIAAGAAVGIARQKIKIISFAYVQTHKLRVDAAATVRGKHDSNGQGRRMVLIYKTIMDVGSALKSEMCKGKSDKSAKQRWLICTPHQLDEHHATATTQTKLAEDETME